MAGQLRLAAAKRCQHRQREQFPGFQIKTRAGQEITEAVGGQVTLDVQLIGRGLGVHLVDARTEQLLLDFQTPGVSCLRIRGRLAGQGQGNSARSEYLVRHVEEVEDPCHAGVRNGLVDDLLDFDWCDADLQGGAEHDAILGHRVAGNEGSKLDHEPQPHVERSVLDHLAEGPVVEDLDELRVRGPEGRPVVGEQRIVMALRIRCDSHRWSSYFGASSPYQ